MSRNTIFHSFSEWGPIIKGLSMKATETSLLSCGFLLGSLSSFTSCCSTYLGSISGMLDQSSLSFTTKVTEAWHPLMCLAILLWQSKHPLRIPLSQMTAQSLLVWFNPKQSAKCVTICHSWCLCLIDQSSVIVMRFQCWLSLTINVSQWIIHMLMPSMSFSIMGIIT